MSEGKDRQALAALFSPVRIGRWSLPSRLVMAPMTRNRSPGGVPPAEVAAYYARRARSGVGLIITEGMTVDHPSASGYRDVPRLERALPHDGFERIAREVHAHGALVIPQLWHVGSIRKLGREPVPTVPGYGPSPVPHPAYGTNGPVPHAMDETDIRTMVEAFATSARIAFEAGYDGVEIHGAHGYLIDQFFWPRTNRRTDAYGGDVLGRTRFAREIVRAVREATAPDFPIVLRFSQWKLGAYDERLFPTEAALAEFLEPLVDAGVDVFHPSTRRMLEPAFEGDPRSLAGVTKRLTGRPTIGVGSVGIDFDVTSTNAGEPARSVPIDLAVERLAAGEFDLLAVGRAMLAEPRWAELAREGRLAEARPYSKASEDTLE